MVGRQLTVVVSGSRQGFVRSLLQSCVHSSYNMVDELLLCSPKHQTIENVNFSPQCSPSVACPFLELHAIHTIRLTAANPSTGYHDALNSRLVLLVCLLTALVAHLQGMIAQICSLISSRQRETSLLLELFLPSESQPH